MFKRLDDVVKSIKELFLRQDEQALEMQRLKNKLNELEESLRQSSYRSSSNERTLHIVGRKPNVKPLYMMGK